MRIHTCLLILGDKELFYARDIYDLLFSNFLFVGSLYLDSMLKYQTILVFFSHVIGEIQFYPIYGSSTLCIL